MPGTILGLGIADFPSNDTNADGWRRLQLLLTAIGEDALHFAISSHVLLAVGFTPISDNYTYFYLYRAGST
jgi:hypothetical protein